MRESETVVPFVRSSLNANRCSERSSFSEKMKRHLPPFFASFRSSKRKPPTLPSTQQNGIPNSHSFQIASVQPQNNEDTIDENFGASSTCIFCQPPPRSADPRLDSPTFSLRASPIRRSFSSGWSSVTKIHLNGDVPRKFERITLSARELNAKSRRVLILDDEGKFEQEESDEDDTRQIQVLHDVPSEFAASTSETPQSPTRALAAMELVAQQPLLFQNEPGTSKTTHVLNEMLSTERTYVNELESVIEFYIKPFESPENQQQIPPALRDQTFLVFGNLRQLFEMHSREVLPAFVRFSSSPFQLCRFLINFRDRLLKPYRQFSQNRPLSDSFRAEHQVDECRFFVDCQRRAKHQLPISSYVLQPIQRLGRYPLLLKQLLSFAIEENESEELCQEIQKAFVAMTELITQVNSEMQQLHICGYAENLRMLGPLRLQTECEIFTFKRKSRRLGNKPQKRHLFLFDGGVLFCKRRAQPLPYSSEFYEHKFCIPIASLGFAECSKSAPDRFELWDENKSDGYAVYTTDERARANWINKLAHITVLNAHHQQQHSINKQPRLQHQNSQQQSPTKATSQAQTQSSTSRPHSWTSDSTTVSSRSSTSAFDDASSTTHTECIYTPDSNGNHPNPMDGSHSTCTSISSGSRRSSTTAGSVDDNNSTATPSIHTSKSLQNAAINGARELVRETAVSEV